MNNQSYEEKHMFCDRMNTSLNQIDPIGLGDLPENKLMRRFDTKFLVKKESLPHILKLIKSFYFILEISSKRLCKYQNLYFDTDDQDFYLDHHRKKNKRSKVRIRKYVDNNAYFLEIKNKFKGITDKKRICIDSFELQKKYDDFLNQSVLLNSKLNPVLWNSYERISLISKNGQERLSIDLDLSFQKDEYNSPKSSFAIVELKQEKICRSSPFYCEIKKLNIKPTSFSKYCTGMILTKQVKKFNRFKSTVLKL